MGAYFTFRIYFYIILRYLRVSRQKEKHWGNLHNTTCVAIYVAGSSHRLQIWSHAYGMTHVLIVEIKSWIIFFFILKYNNRSSLFSVQKLIFIIVIVFVLNLLLIYFFCDFIHEQFYVIFTLMFLERTHLEKE